MAEIIQAFTLERRLFRPDSIPWPFLLTESGREALRAKFKLTQIALEAAATGAVAKIIATRGDFSFEGRTYLIEQFAVEPSALQAQINADSDLADAFMEDVISLLRGMRPESNAGTFEELTRSYQTVVIARLSVEPEEILSERVQRFVREDAAPRLSRPDSAVTIQLASLSWLVSYRTRETDYSLTQKPLTIEPRLGSKPEDRVYYTVSPADYRTHLEILEALEQRMAGPRPASKMRPARRTR